MNDTYNFGNSQSYVCITRPAPLARLSNGQKNLLTLFQCALNTETINEMRKNNSFAVFYLKTLSRHAHRSLIKDYF